MRHAIALAQEARQAGEVPVGAIVVDVGGRVVGAGRNNPIASHDPTGHAEIVALRHAAETLGNYRLAGCTLYVTLEPCPMCAGAILAARVARVVYGADDPRTGAAGSVVDLFALPLLNHHTRIERGVLREECTAQLLEFFAERRVADKAKRLIDTSLWPLPDWALRTPESAFARYCANLAEDGNLVAQLPSSIFRHDLAGCDGLRIHASDSSRIAAQSQAKRHPFDAIAHPVHASLAGSGLEEGTAAAAPQISVNDAESSIAWLCLHGAASWSWRFNAWADALVAAGERVLLIDMPGFGRSDKPKRRAFHTIERHCEILDRWMDSLGRPRYRLICAADDCAFALQLTQVLGSGCVGIAFLPPPADLSPDAWPYPDAGHRAGPIAFAHLAGPGRAGVLMGENAGVTSDSGDCHALFGKGLFPYALAPEPDTAAIMRLVKYFV